MYTIDLLDHEGRTVAGPRNLLDLAQPFFQYVLGRQNAHSKKLILLYPVAGGDNDLPGKPYLSYRTPKIGYAKLLVMQGDRVIYQHPHTVGEIVVQGIRDWLGELDDADSVTAYRLIGPDIDALQKRTTPDVAGVTEIQPYAEGEQPGFRIRPIPPPPPERRSLASLHGQPFDASWLKPGRTDFVKVLVAAHIHEKLVLTHPFSTDVEEGGFLIGRVYEDAEQPDTFLVTVTAALPAQQTGASLLHFTFTGDSFDQVKRTIDRKYRGESILGWYHTHLFAATNDRGLSTIDFRLHFSTFRIPWQIAGLVNIDGNNHRVLRFYVRRNKTMELCPHQTVPITS